MLKSISQFQFDFHILLFSDILFLQKKFERKKDASSSFLWWRRLTVHRLFSLFLDCGSPHLHAAFCLLIVPRIFTFLNFFVLRKHSEPLLQKGLHTTWHSFIGLISLINWKNLNNKIVIKLSFVYFLNKNFKVNLIEHFN